jgi:hypothetical protein
VRLKTEKPEIDMTYRLGDPSLGRPLRRDLAEAAFSLGLGLQLLQVFQILPQEPIRPRIAKIPCIFPG